jgi:hypothetical protein
MPEPVQAEQSELNLNSFGIFGNLTHGSSLQASDCIAGKQLDTTSTAVGLGDDFTNPLVSPNVVWTDSVYQAELGPLPSGNYVQGGTVGKKKPVVTDIQKAIYLVGYRAGSFAQNLRHRKTQHS